MCWPHLAGTLRCAEEKKAQILYVGNVTLSTSMKEMEAHFHKCQMPPPDECDEGVLIKRYASDRSLSCSLVKLVVLSCAATYVFTSHLGVIRTVYCILSTINKLYLVHTVSVRNSTCSD